MQSYSKANLDFDFDWNDYRTIATNQNKIAAIASLVKTSSPPEDSKSQQELGLLAFKLGTFYNHIKRDPDAAIEVLTIAERLLQGEELAWVQNHLAFSYQQKFAIAQKSAILSEIGNNYRLAIQYCNTVIHHFSFDEKLTSDIIKIVSFTYCVKALIEYEDKSLAAALKSYQYALNLYEKYSLLDDQYIRAKNRWAMMLVENKQLTEAQQAFKEIQTYWEQHNDPMNPYSARFYVIYGDFLKNSHEDNWEFALKKYQAAYQTIQRIEGEDSPFAKDIDKKITEIIKQHINRFQIHILAHKYQQELEKVIQLFKDFTNNNENIDHPKYIEKLKAISIYYAFYKRDKDAALIYLTKSLAPCKTEEEKIAVLCITAYVQTIDPNFIDEDNIFADVISKLDHSEEKSSYKQASEAFALQYQAMIIHRRAILKVATNNNIEQALSLIDRAIDIQSALIETMPLLKIGLAESKHLKAVMLYRLATHEQDEIKKQQKFADTEVLLAEAIQLEKQFCQQTQSPHFLLATTLQSLARLLKNIGKSSEAHAHYHLALEIQTTMFGNKPHEDIAKTWHFWAETYAEEQNHEKAIDAFLNALLMKYKIIYANSNMTKETENALLTSLNTLYTQNKALALTKYQEVYNALTSEENKQVFKNVDMSFTQLIQHKLRECKANTALRAYSLYSIDPNDPVNNRSQLVEDNQLAAKTPALQRSTCENFRR